jgi:phosphoenolpyruvate phosphomutase
VTEVEVAQGKARLLRELISGRRIVRVVGAHNGLTARLAQEASFDAVWASGFEVSASFGVPDASLLSMTQLLDAAEAMDMACTLPVIADCDTGFGGPLNVDYLVRRYERRGIAGVCIEDKVFPKINSFAAASHELVPIPDFVQKLLAGRVARRSPDFVIIARTEALVAGLGVDEALDRANAYADAADAVLVHSKSREPQQILDFAAKWDHRAPLVAVPTTYDGVYEQELEDAGFRMVIYANHGLRAAIRGVRTALATLASARRSRDIAHQIASMSEVFTLQQMPASYETHE